MKGTDLLYQGQAVTLEEMLQARDKRAARQRQALNCYRLPLISLTLVAPGAVKNSAVWRRVARLCNCRNTGALRTEGVGQRLGNAGE